MTLDREDIAAIAEEVVKRLRTAEDMSNDMAAFMRLPREERQRIQRGKMKAARLAMKGGKR